MPNRTALGSQRNPCDGASSPRCWAPSLRSTPPNGTTTDAPSRGVPAVRGRSCVTSRRPSRAPRRKRPGMSSVPTSWRSGKSGRHVPSQRSKPWQSVPLPDCPPKEEEKEGAGDGSDSSSNEQIRLDPCCVFDRYFRDEEGKGKGKDRRG